MFEDKVEGCYIQPRENDGPLFFGTGGIVRCSLEKYAIIPMEVYYDLKEKSDMYDDLCD